MKIKMNKKLDAIVIQNSPMNTLVYDLLEAVNRDGQITLLLRVVSEAKPHRPDLRKAIEAHCPQALEAPLLGVQAQAVVTGLGDLQSQVESNPTVRNVIAASRDKLEQLRKDLTSSLTTRCCTTAYIRFSCGIPKFIDKAKQFEDRPARLSGPRDQHPRAEGHLRRRPRSCRIVAGRGGRSRTRDAVGGETGIGGYRIE